MALLFVDGFDHYVTADLSKKWTALNGSPTISAGNGRRSTAGLVSMTGSTYVTKTITAGASFVMGCSLQVGTTPSSPGASLFGLIDAGSQQCELRINADLTLSITRATTSITGGTSTLTLSVGSNYYIEWKVTISDSIAANTCKVRVNGVDWLTVPTSSDLKATANASANQVRLGNILGNSMGSSTYIDDFYICDSSGSTNNDFLGDVRIDTLFPNGEGAHLDYTPSTGTTHYTLVDETAPNTSDYNESGTAGQKDSYAMQDLSVVSGVIYAVQAAGAILKDDAGARSVKVGIRSSGTDATGAALALSTSQLYYTAIHETNPSTSAAWTEAGVNGCETLYEIV